MNRDELMKTLKDAGIDCDRAEDYIGDGATDQDMTGVCVYLDDPDNETVNFYLYPADDGWHTVDGIWVCEGDILGDGDVVGYVHEQQMEYNSNFPDWDPVKMEWRTA